MPHTLERRLKAVEQKMSALVNVVTNVTYAWVDVSGEAWMTVSTKPKAKSGDE